MIRILLTMILLLGTLLPIHAEDLVQVDKKIVLLLDASGSMSTQAFKWQLDGYADALDHPSILTALNASTHKKIAITVLQFSSNVFLSLDWTIVDSDNINDFADQVRSIERAQYLSTAIGNGLNVARKMIQESPHIQATQTIILVSGDGVNNHGIPAWPISQEISEYLKVTIVGVVIPIPRQDVPKFYRTYVTFGPGNFIQIAEDSNDFKKALLNVLTLNDGN
jgi:hypothetical protein